MRRITTIFPAAAGAVTGLSIQLNHLASASRYLSHSPCWLLLYLALSALCGALLAHMVRHVLLRIAPGDRSRGVIEKLHSLSFLAFVPVGLGVFGFPMESEIGIVITLASALLFIVINALSVAVFSVPEGSHSVVSSPRYLAVLFFLSGLAALIYQIVWERVLFSSFGVNIESVTIIVTVFMLGLGLGALLGGRLSEGKFLRLPFYFLIMETSIGLFGLISLPLIRSVGLAVAGEPRIVVVAALMLLLLPPTMMMGTTLPILVQYLISSYKSMGRTVGILYFANTLGSAFSCLIAAHVLFVYGGLQAAVVFAAFCNLSVGLLVFDYTKRIAKVPAPGGLT